MLQIEYNGSFIHLAKGTAVEIEKNSPLFFIDTVLAEYSMPLTIVNDEHNVDILGDVFHRYGIKSKLKLPVNIYDGGTYFTSGTLVIDRSLNDQSVRGRGNVQGYILTGISDFFSVVKDKKLASLLLGGIRRFNFTSWDPFDSSDGWWQNFHATWNNTEDYLMAPHRNETWVDNEGYDGWLNQMGYGYLGGIPQFEPGQVEALSWVVLWPRLKYVLEQLFIENGWSVDFSGINDTDWENLFLFNSKPVQTTVWDASNTINPRTTIAIQLSDFISPEIYCTQFLLSICKKYGWAPICDGDTKTCRIVALKESTKGSLKDFTQYATPVTSIDFTEDLRKFSFTNSFPGNDAYPSTPDFTNFIKQPPVASFNDLPTPTLNLDTSIIYCFKENAYYRVQIDTLGDRFWEKHSDGIYNYEVENATDSFDTDCTTLPMQLSVYRETIAGVKYYGYFPICKQPRNKEWGLRTLYYHGMVKELTESGAEGVMDYPLASSVVVLPNGTINGNWSNVYKHSNGTTDYGLIQYWWAEWLRVLKVNNIVEIVLNIPLYELAQLKWDDVLNIHNQPYLLKKYVEPHPYKGFIQATLHPLLLDDNDPAIQVTETIYYLKAFFENIVDSTNPYFDNLKLCDVVVRCYSDAAGTNLVMPTNPITMNIVFKAIPVATGIPVYGGPEQHSIDGAENLVIPEAMYSATDPTTSSDFDYRYEILPGTGYLVI